MHHVAFHVPDRDTLLSIRQQLLDGGSRPTPEIDRFYFLSVYFREPGGILFEIATDDPGFAVDETAGVPLASAMAAAVLIHGRGADAASILGLTEPIDVPNIAWLAPQAEGGTWYPQRFTWIHDERQVKQARFRLQAGRRQ